MRRPDPDPADSSAVLAGIVLAAAAGVWTAGTAVAWAWRGRTPGVPLVGALALLVRTATSPAHPASAWPPGSALPPTWVLLASEAVGASAAVTAAVVIAVAVGGRWTPARTERFAMTGRSARNGGGARRGLSRRRRSLLSRQRRGLLPRPAADDTAGWARRRDLMPLRVGAPQAGRLTLGRAGRTLLAAERRASLVVLGPSQSGKTTGLAIPAILEWQGPVVATSVKSDLVRDTLARRSARGPAWVYDPTGATGQPGAGWSPLAGAGTWQGARRTAAWLCGAVRSGSGGGSTDEDFWYAAAAKLLAPYLLAASLTGVGVDGLVRWIDIQEEPAVASALTAEGQGEALNAAIASWQRDDRTRSSVFTTAEMVLEAYADPTILRSAATSDIDPVRLLAGGSPTLYVCAPGHEQERLRPVFATLLQTILNAAYDAALARHGSLDPPLLIVLDEAANIAPLRDLDTIASTAAGHGIQLVTVWQDLAQLRARYGERAATVVNNHRAKLFLSALSDPGTLEYASRLIGDAEVAEHAFTIDASGARSTTRSRRAQRLAPDAELRRIRPGEGVLVYGHLPPVRVRLRPWFTEGG